MFITTIVIQKSRFSYKLSNKLCEREISSKLLSIEMFKVNYDDDFGFLHFSMHVKEVTGLLKKYNNN